MSKRKRVAVIPVTGSYTDYLGNSWEFTAKVAINTIYEVEEVTELQFNPLTDKEQFITTELISQLETMAGIKALEKICPDDFIEEEA